MLNFLGNVRDMKAPLASGMILLIALYLVFFDLIAGTPADNFFDGALARLSAYIGPVATLGMVTFSAYILGVLLSLHKIARAALAPKSFRFQGILFFPAQLSAVSQRRLYDHVETIANKFLDYHPLRRLVTEIGHKPKNDDERMALERSSSGEFVTEDTLGDAYWMQLIKEKVAYSIVDKADIYAIQLGTKREKAFDRFDKARGEAEFRYSLILPLLLLGSMTLIELVQLIGPLFPGDWRLFLLIIFPTCLVTCLFIISFRAGQKLQEANEEIINGVIMGEIEIEPLQLLAALESQRQDRNGAGFWGKLRKFWE